MGWRNPRDWTTGQTVTVWQLNTEIRDNTNCARQFWHNAVRVNLSTAQAVDTSEQTPLHWDELTWSLGDQTVWDRSAPTKFLAPVPGWYYLAAACELDNASGGSRGLGYRVTGSLVVWGLDSLEDSAGIEAAKLAGQDVVQMTTADSVETVVYQSSSDSLNANDGTDATYAIWRFVAEAT